MTDAIFAFDEHTEIDTVYIIDQPHHNTLATIYRQKGDPQWTLKIRFRQLRDDKVWDSKDSKRVLEGTGSLEQLHSAMDENVKAAFLLGAEVHVLPVHGGTDELQRVMSTVPGAHTKMEWLH